MIRKLFMEIKFPYREHGVAFRLPEDAEVFHPAVRTPITGTYIAIIKNLLRPLGYKQTLFDLAKRCKTACVVADAYCPPPANRQILNPIVKTLHAAGMSHDDITILVTSEYPAEFSPELVHSMFDEEFSRRYHVGAHDVFAHSQHELIGETSGGIPVWLDRRLKMADIKIITGGIYPHYLFGYAGAPLLPPFAVTGLETIQALYDIADLDNVDFQWFDQKSKLSSELLEIVNLARLDFIVSISIDNSFRFIDIFSGKPFSVMKAIGQRHIAAEYDVLRGKADIAISCTGHSHCEMSWYHNLMGLCLARTFLRNEGILIYITPLFDQVGARIRKIRNKAALIDFLSTHKMIDSTRDRIFSCLQDGVTVFVSPKLGDATLKDQSRDVFFCSSVDSALAFAAQRSKVTPHLVLLPDGLFTFLSMSS
ncbi:DUF2088 domain-containing protein [candidate division KSB1 bacterium]|nr:DUF2088 domain-containing protein [candidate division KSB1 bacterium]